MYICILNICIYQINVCACACIGPRLNIGRQVIRDVARTPEVDDFDLAPTHTHQHTHDMQIIYQIQVLLCDYLNLHTHIT